jgi:lactate dehydrogenase-like 2-hydroxyacid dehydrogenase
MLYCKIIFIVKALGGKLVTVDELVEKSDFIILAIALNEDTKFIINGERLAKMKSHAILVNIGRGGQLKMF